MKKYGVFRTRLDIYCVCGIGVVLSGRMKYKGEKMRNFHTLNMLTSLASDIH